MFFGLLGKVYKYTEHAKKNSKGEVVGFSFQKTGCNIMYKKGLFMLHLPGDSYTFNIVGEVQKEFIKGENRTTFAIGGDDRIAHSVVLLVDDTKLVISESDGSFHIHGKKGYLKNEYEEWVGGQSL